ncbi:MAG: RNA 3'-phosphate cyclase [Euryarchaeota archaeon]|nr:RNA 3'-phosphate cyclase [Euryarchaeota archaeon]
MSDGRRHGDIIEIDGAEGEGGGQIVRTAVALSALTGKDVAIANIRAGRPRPGLGHQHLSSIRATADICDADVTGDAVGSTRIEFHPNKVRSGIVRVDVGTAGSVGLVLQSSLLALANDDGDSKLEVLGGTDVKLAPSITYLELVLFPLLGRMGFHAKLESYERGFYPEGGGMCRVSWTGTKEPTALQLGSRGRFVGIGGSSYAQNLPDHIPDRMSMGCKKALVAHQPVDIRVERSKGRSSGAGVVLYAEFEGTRIGSSCLGERGVPSEKVAQTASKDLLRMLSSGSTSDPHAADQLLPYMALSRGPSVFIVDAITSHLRTQFQLVRRFVDVSIDVQGGGPFIVNVRPNRT